MINHSIKVPRLYKVSALVAREVSEGIGSIKSLVYEHQKKHPNIKAIYALVSTLFQKSGEIETLLKRSQLLVKETRFDPWLAKVLIVELLWGKKNLPGQSKPENTIRAYEQIFKAHLSDTSTKENDYQANDTKPRYVRINTLVSSLNEAIKGFRDEGWTLIKFLDKKDYKGYLEKISCLNNDEFMVDIHVPNLLVFPPKTEFYQHPAYKNGSIILQDKASCLPVHILGAPPGSTILDMCAAPGMKTTHLAAALDDKGTVYATERNPKRFEVLNTIVSKSGAKCIKTFNKDVLDCTKDDFPGVEYILVDPSCSGTGMTYRQENEVNSARLSSLTGFQIKILRHALTRFPDVKKVVYSTCSVLPEENEDVVRQVLETNYNFKLIPASQFVGEIWQSFGSSEYGDIGKYCLYAKAAEDYTNGFFVAVFERLKEGEENSFFNTRIFNFKKHVQANEKWKTKKELKYNQNNFESMDESDVKVNKNQMKKNKNFKADWNATSENNKNSESIYYEKEPENKNKIKESTAENSNMNNHQINLNSENVKNKRRKNKHKSTEQNSNESNLQDEDNITSEFSKKKKKKRENKDKCEVFNVDDESERRKEKKKKNQELNTFPAIDESIERKSYIKHEEFVNDETSGRSLKKAKKRKRKESVTQQMADEFIEDSIGEVYQEKTVNLQKIKKKKKTKNVEDASRIENENMEDRTVQKKEETTQELTLDNIDIQLSQLEYHMKKKKKKNKHKNTD